MLKLNALVIRALKWRLWMQRNRRIFEDKSFSLEFSWDCFHLNTSWWCHSYSKLFCHIPISLILLDCKLFVSSSLGGGFAFLNEYYLMFLNQTAPHPPTHPPTHKKKKKKKPIILEWGWLMSFNDLTDLWIVSGVIILESG